MTKPKQQNVVRVLLDKISEPKMTMVVDYIDQTVDVKEITTDYLGTFRKSNLGMGNTYLLTVVLNTPILVERTMIEISKTLTTLRIQHDIEQPHVRRNIRTFANAIAKKLLQLSDYDAQIRNSPSADGGKLADCNSNNQHVMRWLKAFVKRLNWQYRLTLSQHQALAAMVNSKLAMLPRKPGQYTFIETTDVHPINYGEQVRWNIRTDIWSARHNQREGGWWWAIDCDLYSSEKSAR